MKLSTEHKEILLISKKKQEQILITNNTKKKALHKQKAYLQEELNKIGKELSGIHQKKTILNKINSINDQIFFIDTNQESKDLIAQAEKACLLLNNHQKNSKQNNDTKNISTLFSKNMKKQKTKSCTAKNKILNSLLIQKRKRKYFPSFEVNTNKSRKILQNFKNKIKVPCKTNISSTKHCEFCKSKLMYNNQLKQSICTSCYSIQSINNIDNNILTSTNNCYKREIYFVDTILAQTAQMCNVTDEEMNQIKLFLKQKKLPINKYSIDTAIKQLKQNKNSKYKIGILYKILDEPFPYIYSTKDFYFAIDLFNIYNQQFDLLVASQIIKERVNFPYVYAHYRILKIIFNFHERKNASTILHFFYTLLEIQRKESEIVDLWKTIESNCKHIVDTYLQQIKK